MSQLSQLNTNRACQFYNHRAWAVLGEAGGQSGAGELCCLWEKAQDSSDTWKSGVHGWKEASGQEPSTMETATS